MELLDDDLRQQLPPIRKLHSPEGDGQRMVYAKFVVPAADVAFYVAEGEEQKTDYVFWGLLVAPQFRFPVRLEITLATLQTEDWLGKEPASRDPGFKPAPWGMVERAVPHFHRPLTAP